MKLTTKEIMEIIPHRHPFLLIDTIEDLVPGEHNILNSLSAIATCVNMGIEYPTIIKGLEKYSGTDRRFQEQNDYHQLHAPFEAE